MSTNIEELEALAVKLRNTPLNQQLIFEAISEIEDLRKQRNDLLQENRELRADGKKTHYERQREIEDEIYYRKHGNLGYK